MSSVICNRYRSVACSIQTAMGATEQILVDTVDRVAYVEPDGGAAAQARGVD